MEVSANLRETRRWVTQSFVEDGLDDLLDEGTVFEGNPPVYVRKVTYGRMLTLAFSSAASSSDMRDVIDDSLSAFREGRAPASDVRLAAIRDASTGAVIFRGRNQDDASKGVKNWKLRDFFEDDLSLSNAVPIEIELRNVIDGTPAGRTEVEEFDETRCMPVIADDGPFEFGLEERLESPFDADGFTLAHSGDFNGDGITDVLWNLLTDDENSALLAYGSPVGLQLAPRDLLCGEERCTFAEPDGAQWTDFQLLIGNFDGDRQGRDDLLWVQTIPTAGKVQYRLFLLLATRDGFENEPVEQTVEIAEPLPVHELHSPVIGDIDADGADDVAFAIISYEDLGANEMIHQHPHIALSTPQGDAPFSEEVYTNTDIGNTNRDKASTLLRFDLQDFDGDGYLDLSWSLLGLQRSDGDRDNIQHPQLRLPEEQSLTFGAPIQFGYASTGWDYYEPFYGDFDGDSDSEMAFLRVTSNSSFPPVAVHALIYDPNVPDGSMFSKIPYSDWGTADNSGQLEVGDVVRGYRRQITTLAVNGDAPMDIVATSLVDETGARNDRMNAIIAMLGRPAGQSFPANAAGLFDMGLAPQVYPVDQDWTAFSQVLTGDFNGDGLGDVLYNDPGSVNRTYVAFGKRDLEE